MAFAIPLAAGAAGAMGFTETAAALTAFGGSTAASVFGGLSTAASVLGSIQQGQAAKKSANYNAQVQEHNAQLSERNATLASQEGAANTAIEQQKTRAGVAGMKAAQAANGIDVDTGSAVDVRSSAAELGELNAITVRSNAVKQAYGYQTQAASDKAQAELDRQEAKSSEDSGLINAGTTLLGNAKNASDFGWLDFNNKKSLGGENSFYGPSTLPWQNAPGYGQ